MEIYDRTGRLLASSDPPDSRIFNEMVLQNAFLPGRELEGVSLGGPDLSYSNFDGSDLFGAFLCGATFDLCSLVNGDLRSSFLFKTSFRNADLRGARFCPDALGGVLVLNSVDFSNANLEGADFTGALYDSATIFPAGFKPEEHGMKAKL